MDPVAGIQEKWVPLHYTSPTCPIHQGKLIQIGFVYLALSKGLGAWYMLESCRPCPRGFLQHRKKLQTLRNTLDIIGYAVCKECCGFREGKKQVYQWSKERPHGGGVERWFKNSKVAAHHVPSTAQHRTPSMSSLTSYPLQEVTNETLTL